MKKFILIFFIVISFILIGHSIFSQYVKISFSNKIRNLSGNTCQISFSAVAMKSFSFPFHFNFELDEPSLSCLVHDHILQQKYDFKIFSKNIFFSFNLFSKDIKLSLPNDVKFLNDAETVSCSGFNNANFLFFDNILPTIMSKKFETTLRQVSYNNNHVKCVDSNNNTFLHNLSLDFVIGSSSNQINNIDLLVKNFHSTPDRNIRTDIDLLLNIPASNKFSLLVKNFVIKSNHLLIKAAGKLTTEEQHYLSGKLVIDVNNYRELINKLSDANDNIKNVLDVLNKFVNYIDEDRFSIIIQNIGQELYIGKQNFKELFMLFSNT